MKNEQDVIDVIQSDKIKNKKKVAWSDGKDEGKMEASVLDVRAPSYFLPDQPAEPDTGTPAASHQQNPTTRGMLRSAASQYRVTTTAGGLFLNYPARKGMGPRRQAHVHLDELDIESPATSTQEIARDERSRLAASQYRRAIIAGGVVFQNPAVDEVRNRVEQQRVNQHHFFSLKNIGLGIAVVGAVATVGVAFSMIKKK